MIALINDRVVAVRGADIQQLGMFSYVSVEAQVPADHPIRKLRVLVDTILKKLDALLRGTLRLQRVVTPLSPA